MGETTGTFIYGFSDDLIEVCNIHNLPNGEEWYLEDDGVIACSDGTILTVNYDDEGMWRFGPVIRGNAFGHILPATGDDGDKRSEYDGAPDYSEVAVFLTQLDWVAYGKVARARTKRTSSEPTP